MNAPSAAGWYSVLAGAIVTILVWILKTYTNVSMDPLTQGACVTLATAIVAEYWPAPPTTKPPPTA